MNISKADTLFQPFTHSFPRADIHELLSPDLLHQVIKGIFKDHLVQWVGIILSATRARPALTKSWVILTDGKFRRASTTFLIVFPLGFPLFRHFKVFGGFLTGATSLNGQATILKRS
jgi:hypothetical protein